VLFHCFEYFVSIFIRVFSFIHISDRFACYLQHYHRSFVLLVFLVLLLLESYIHIWIAQLSWFYLVLVSISQELHGETRGMSVRGY